VRLIQKQSKANSPNDQLDTEQQQVAANEPIRSRSSIVPLTSGPSLAHKPPSARNSLGLSGAHAKIKMPLLLFSLSLLLLLVSVCGFFFNFLLFFSIHLCSLHAKTRAESPLFALGAFRSLCIVCVCSLCAVCVRLVCSLCAASLPQQHARSRLAPSCKSQSQSFRQSFGQSFGQSNDDF